MNSIGKPYLEGSNAQTRIYILNMLKLAYQGLGAKILSTPLPDGLTEEILIQVQANLTQMATPYITVSSDYERLQSEEINKLDEISKLEIQSQLIESKIDYISLIKDETFEVNLASNLEYNIIRDQKLKLNKNPLDLNALNLMEGHFKTVKNNRMASYFTGRINSLKEKND
jgi:hypothetical protein